MLKNSLVSLVLVATLLVAANAKADIIFGVTATGNLANGTFDDDRFVQPTGRIVEGTNTKVTYGVDVSGYDYFSFLTAANDVTYATDVTLLKFLNGVGSYDSENMFTPLFGELTSLDNLFSVADYADKDGMLWFTYYFASRGGVQPIGFGFALSNAPTPEPATLVILGIGLAGLGLARRRKMKTAK